MAELTARIKVDVTSLDVPLMIVVDNQGQTSVYRHGKKLSARSVKFSAELDSLPVVTIEECLK